MNRDQNHALGDIHGQLTGSPLPGEFPGWPQLGDRTVVDALAAIGERLELDGFKAPQLWEPYNDGGAGGSHDQREDRPPLWESTGSTLERPDGVR